MSLSTVIIIAVSIEGGVHEPTDIGRYLHREHYHIGSTISVCGKLGDVRVDKPYIVLFDSDSFDGLFVDKSVPTWRSGNLTCVRGVMTREDGLSKAEVFVRKSFPMMYDSPNPAYIIRNE